MRELLPVPGWPAGRGGRPERQCHRQMIYAVRYLVDNGGRFAASLANSVAVTDWGCATVERNGFDSQ